MRILILQSSYPQTPRPSPFLRLLRLFAAKDHSASDQIQLAAKKHKERKSIIRHLPSAFRCLSASPHTLTSSNPLILVAASQSRCGEYSGTSCLIASFSWLGSSSPMRPSTSRRHLPAQSPVEAVPSELSSMIR